MPRFTQTKPTTMTMLLLTLMTMLQLPQTQSTQNLFLNPSFEEDLGGTWNIKGFTGQRFSGDSLHGQYSLRASDRSKDLKGPSQYVRGMKMGRGYELTAYVKLLNDRPGKLWQSLKAIIKFDFTVKVEGNKITPLSERPPRCVGLKNQERKDCLAVLRQWRAQMKKEREEKRKQKLQQKQERQRKREEEKKKAKEQKEKAKDKKKKDRQREKNKKQKDRKKKKNERDKAKKEKENTRSKAKEQKEKEKRKEKEQREKEKDKKKEEREKERNRKKEQRERERPRNKDKNDRESQRARSRTQKDTDKDKATENSKSKKASETSVHLDSLPDTSASVRTRRDVFHSILRRRQQFYRQRREAEIEPRRQEIPEDGELVSSGIETAVGAYIIGWRAFVTSRDGWVLLTGSINAPMLPFRGAEFAIRGPDKGIDFLVDNLTLLEIPERSDWLAESHAMIDRHRKSNVSISVTTPAGVNREEVELEVELKQHLFAFGSKAEDKLLYRKSAHKFREVFFNLFNWATIGSYKWRFDKSNNLYKPNFKNAEKATEVLNENGVKVRAHSILWGVQKNIPKAVLETPPDELPKLLKHHTEYMINITKGKVEHWDVQNEFLHGHWYEETLQDPNVTQNVFKIARPLDPEVKLYLNDFTAVTSGANTEELHDVAMRFIKAGTGIQGLGVQGHVKEYIKPTPTMIWRRLDRLADTGLEVFMTEFDIGWADDVVRADWFEDSMRAFFAHPGLHGVILWGFWKDWQTYKDKYLVYGPDLTFAEPGERFVCLTQKEWTTRATFVLSKPDLPTLRGFQGEYDVIIKKRGVPVQRETFTLGKKDTTINIHVTESNTPITVNRKHDYVPQCISHRDQKSLGMVTCAQSDPTDLTCSDRMSDASGTLEGAEVSITCLTGEIMTSCNSYQEDYSSKGRRGERISVKDNVAKCTAVKGSSSSGGVRAIARCCQARGLECDYRRAGPSNPMDGALAEATCSRGNITLGCSIFNKYSVLDGAFPSNTMTSCFAQSGPPWSQVSALKTGAVSYAACCRKTGLRCRKVESDRQPFNDGIIGVTCSPDEVMTGCNFKAEDGEAAGAHIYTDPNSGTSHCNAFVGKDLPDLLSAKVSAVAICCSKN